MKTNKKAYFYVITAASLWASLGIFVKVLNEYGFSTKQIVFIRAAFALFTLSIFLIMKTGRLPVIKPKDSIYFIGTGICSFLFFNWCYFTAIKLTSLSVAAVLLYTAPAIVMLLSAVLFKEKMSLRKVIALVLTFIGCVFVTAFVQEPGYEVTVKGILAGLGAGLGYALYSIFGRYALMKYDSITVTLYTFLFASISLIPITAVKNIITLFSNMNVVFFAAALGVVATVLPYLLYTKGLSFLEAGNASIIATLEPIIATVLGIIFYGEPITLFKILGIMLVVFAVSIIK